jgi:propionyl-CoA carboxylase alpha chain
MAAAPPPRRVISRLLVANRGEIARRIFRTCRELGIATVAVYSEADAEAPFVAEADEAVQIGGPAPRDSYLRADAVVDAALATGADAVHPGYGFLAENADFARAVAAAGLVFVGPGPDAIARMGSKIEARALMEGADVPVLPGEVIGPDSDLAVAADRVGYPLLVKASAGGGGKGMRVVREPAELEGSVAAARREALAAFGDDAVFLERYVDEPRHVEIQIFGDGHGKLISLFERDCSVQRRHQKVIEESPSPAIDAALRQRMGEAAVTAGEAIGYVGAGTVEFLLAPGGEFFFLEVNTRLQVEHPVTEAVTGLDLVALQISVAEGRPLPPEATAATMNGHAVEARLYAEDAAAGFLPVTGLLERIEIGGGVRADSGVVDGSRISEHYDPMIAKVIAHGATRDDAVRRLATALQGAELHGLTTNRDFLVRVLRHPEFLAGEADTHFLIRHDPAELGAPLLGEREERVCAIAAALAGQARRRAEASALGGLPSGWRNLRSAPQRAEFGGPRGDHRVEYAFDGGGSLALLVVNDEPIESFELVACDPGEVVLELDGRRVRYRVTPAADGGVYVNVPAGQVRLDEVPRFADAAAAAEIGGSLQAPMPGTVVRTMVSAGDTVAQGDPLIVLEAMKMEHEMVAPEAGTVAELRVGEGDQVEAGATLAVVISFSDDEPVSSVSSPA